ncbi:MAG: 3-deoxy-D-manno-octulosonate 8-phosphate phosphatase [Chitinophagales bacterium]|nr:3-deoxy-D-manno-octulosonate 8-phosphate phosphatase [Chitinophagales bacterium]MDW8428312.1 3-deoxy-D-manno-octulosonate 8-phosphate phosphatase [Chitinophagales bacterium]
MTALVGARKVLELLRLTQAAVFDLDGVLTDGSLLITESGEELRRMDVRDGYAMQVAQQYGLRIYVISGGHSSGVEKRLLRLGISGIRMNVPDKKEALRLVAASEGLDLSTTLYMGDDLLDAEALRICGIPCCPADAVEQIRQLCVYVASRPGGHGCVREVLEKVLTLQGRWAAP